MAVELNQSLLKRLSIYPEQDLRVEELCVLAIEKNILTTTDFLIIRDLTRFSGCDSFAFYLCLVLLFATKNRGSLCLRLEEGALSSLVESLLTTEIAGKGALFLAREMLAWLDQVPVSLVGDKSSLNSPLIIDQHCGVRRLYFQKLFSSEQHVIQKLTPFFQAAPQEVDEAQLQEWGKIFQELLLTPDEGELFSSDAASPGLNQAQLQALVLPLLFDLVIISGGPGTGKTSIVSVLLRIFMRLGYDPARISLAAPTGKASQRMNEAIRGSYKGLINPAVADEKILAIEGVTLHRLLRFSPARNSFVYNAGNPLPYDLVILDEVSMVDIGLMSAFLDAVAPGTKLIFLGDRDQLPSVEAGAVLSDLLPAGGDVGFSNEVAAVITRLVGGAPALGRGLVCDHAIFLQQSYRSQGEILALAERVNKQDLSILDEFPSVEITALQERSDACAFLFAGQDSFSVFDERVHLLDNWFEESYLSGVESYLSLVKKTKRLPMLDMSDKRVVSLLDNLFEKMERVRILGAVKKGFWGTRAVNRYLADCLARQLGVSGENIFSLGVPVMVTENDYAHQLYNGDVGVVLSVRGKGAYAYFRKNDCYFILPTSLLPSCEPAFAITVHKSQGSEYQSVLLILPDEPGCPVLSKEIFYTAVTRAKQKLLLYGRKEIYEETIKKSNNRESGISFWQTVG